MDMVAVEEINLGFTQANFTYFLLLILPKNFLKG